ncbi:hypothetical protein [Foetidibacter luteolus]|uniref:hypothetical protein n=1 Tax=Foetidibacter luteolus TaxID=2608880 RepID=UPI00129B9CD2|nr:hypothetical protein [Foetidibacter luteolus]
MKKIYAVPVLLFCFLFAGFSAIAQSYNLQGRVVDFSSRNPVEAVSVFSSSGRVRITDSLGRFTIPVTGKDSVWFSFLNKNTQKYSIDTIANLSNFEIALHIEATWLPSVKVKSSDYKLDSILNRRNYAKIFDYKKPGLALSSNPPSSYVPGSLTVGLDLDQLINMFRFRKQRQMLSFQERLLIQEQDKYIDHRFNKRLIRQITGIDSGKTLTKFITIYKPAYEILLQMNDIELGYYIQQCYKQFTGKGRQELFLKKPEELEENPPLR